ncbi:acetyl/propionyl/methylcrotonyl-CoA carboxylase subunit alpha [Ferribacterium limneticum]|uniref:acetyl/propionyl/methylcrotonyl-CoA carboxylase subunit alpha n=1 Tax=Ferribacterium limneticum TaxID=76259 RepID=UPI001CF953CD|nr:acetyl/propionyl/methylcrotonyl-CoA carboxylase subunit alpha [Ferribacterium limneticum]UCV28631.1 acetyl/propionyl/methylcrotonyl-CoA carboxylase subunit alpha [Ferribacterium limneticum]UCV32548.1 acetyl/propionyl/methylcrotonyl-CoA carboxylase subunit alpha [Ferribacterium limneticum]
MFNKILIANRGEIACRVIKTARRMGIRTVAVYSEADANARHVRLADEAVLLGPAAARESYLVADKIIDACKRTGAQAVHPGYGFLSENAAFADALAASGITFIGPPASAIRAMGSKSEAKKLMGSAAVPLTPGYHGDDQAPSLLHKEADAIDYPVLIKAAAGGGGKGMRLVEKSEDFLDALASCKREAASSFGNEHVLIEKYITRPRHIEIQVFADSLGNCVYLFERDCSVQRRHQKVLEEAPAPGMPEERRRQMGEAAVAAAKAVDYVGAGTVEFIANQDGSFYFMEMNTRLQVEHPVTEMITGQDLVEWQLRVASGEPLPLRQEQLQIRGHALEARIYAEDASKGFLPATGKLVRLAPPAESLNVRVDTGVEEDDEITPYYDPMIAKLIVWDEHRDAALARMRKALADYQVAGVTTNIDFLSRLVACPAFAGADLDTGLIERQKEFLFPEAQAVPRDVLLVATVGELLWEQHEAKQAAKASGDPYSPWHARDGWRMNLSSARTISFRAPKEVPLGDDGEALVDAHVRYQRDQWQITLNGETTLARGKKLDGDRFAVELDDRRLIASVVAVADKRSIFLQGTTFTLLRDDPLHRVDAGDSHGGGLTAPMPGKVVALLAQPGQKVEKGTPLLILEAMKMEHTITAPAAGIVKAFCYAAGEQVTDGAALVEFEGE